MCSGIFWHGNVSLRAVPMMLSQEAVQLCGHLSGKVSFTALLAYIRRDILEHDQLSIAPYLQGGLA